MKKYLILFTLLLTVLAGCKLDSSTFPESGQSTSTSIVGMWYLKSARSTGKALGFPIDETTAGTSKDYYLFKADGTVDVSSEDDGLEKGTYTYDAGTRKLTMKKAQETNSITITSLTARTMVLTFPLSIPAIGTDLTIVATYNR